MEIKITNEEFIYYTLKKGTNSMKSTIFWVNGIGKIKTRKKVREAMENNIPLKKKCKVTGYAYEADYNNKKWIRIN